jgi:hypothetical protein
MVFSYDDLVRISRDVDSCTGGMWTPAERVLSEAT